MGIVLSVCVCVFSWFVLWMYLWVLFWMLLVGLFVMVCFLEGLFVDTFDSEPSHDDLSQFTYFG